MKISVVTHKQLKGYYIAEVVDDNENVVFWETATSKQAALALVTRSLFRSYETKVKQLKTASEKLNEVRLVLNK